MPPADVTFAACETFFIPNTKGVRLTDGFEPTFCELCVAFIFREIDCKVGVRRPGENTRRGDGRNLNIRELLMRWRWIGLAVLTACGFARAAAFVPTQSMALGQSLSGATLLNDSIYVNPASSAFTSVYSVDGSYLFGPRAFGVSILDTKTSSIGGELGYYHEASV